MEIIGSIILSIIQSVLFYGKEIGISCVLFSIISNIIIYYILYKKGKIQNKIGILLIIPILLLSSTYFIFANKTFYVANIFIILILEIMMYVIIINKKDYFKNHLYNSFELIENTIIDYKSGIQHTKEKAKEYRKDNSKINKENIKKIFMSILIVFAVVGIVILLLASADSIFANLFSRVGKLLNISTIFNLIVRTAIIVIIYFIFLSFFLKIQDKTKEDEKQLKNYQNKYAFTIKLLLICLNLVYVVFCFIQIKSLFAKINIDGAFDYANYARTGFFQLMFVSFINFAIILVSNRFNENKEKIIKILNLLLVIFTIIIAISSMYRMYMYETEYGLTYLRIFVYIILITEILVFIPITIYIFNEKFDFMKWCFIIGISVYCIVNYINIENIIISKNINRNENIQDIDYEYISRIVSIDSYNILEEKINNKKDITPKEKLNILNILQDLANDQKDLSWQEFNISKWKLRQKNIERF